MKIKVSETTNNQIDWLVAKCEGFSYEAYEYTRNKWAKGLHIPDHWKPSENWSQSGPIIDRMFSEGLRIHNAEHVTGVHNSNLIAASLKGSEWFHFGPTLSIAAMRCYIASRMGDNVEVPDNLI